MVLIVIIFVNNLNLYLKGQSDCKARPTGSSRIELKLSRCDSLKRIIGLPTADLQALTTHTAIIQRVETTPSHHTVPPPRFVLKMGREAIMTPVLMDSIR